MTHRNIAPPEAISLFVKNIQVFSEKSNVKNTVLPFYADGYPGLMFQDTASGLQVRPHKKTMPLLFLYGQTIKPIELVMDGAYRLIVFQLYPFVLKDFFNISPGDINDNCYDIGQLNYIKTKNTINQLLAIPSSKERILLITSLLQELFMLKKDALDFKIRQAILTITASNGRVSVRDLCTQLKIKERSFERRFLLQVGISPKHFSKIIQFSESLSQLTGREYERLTDIVYANGFADQSHFIRVFKAFTGKTPKKFAGRLPYNN